MDTKLRLLLPVIESLNRSTSPRFSLLIAWSRLFNSWRAEFLFIFSNIHLITWAFSSPSPLWENKTYHTFSYDMSYLSMHSGWLRLRPFVPFGRIHVHTGWCFNSWRIIVSGVQKKRGDCHSSAQAHLKHVKVHLWWSPCANYVHSTHRRAYARGHFVSLDNTVIARRSRGSTSQPSTIEQICPLY